MRQIQRIKSRFYASVVCFCVFACTFLLMDPFTELVGTARNVSVFLLGAVFWLSLVLGLLLAIAAARASRDYLERAGFDTQRRRLGLLRFFSNKAAAVADVLLAVSVAAAVVMAIHAPQNQYLYFVELFLLALSVSMHCLLNGDTFAAICGFKSIYIGGKH